MCSRCRSGVAVAALLLSLLACEREARDFRGPRTGDTEPGLVATTELQAGGERPNGRAQPGAYQENRWAVSEGKRLYSWYNCSGCHAPGGGGGMGPPHIDGEWVYGSEPAQVYSSIMEGRPNGMPSFRNRVSPSDAWKLVAWVRTLGRLTPPDVWPARADELAVVQRDGPRRGEQMPRTRPPAPRQ